LSERAPRHDDEQLGVSFFRTRLADVTLDGLTLPRTFFGRSEIRGVSFPVTDLSESTANWNDFIDVDFSPPIYRVQTCGLPSLSVSVFAELFYGARTCGVLRSLVAHSRTRTWQARSSAGHSLGFSVCRAHSEPLLIGSHLAQSQRVADLRMTETPNTPLQRTRSSRCGCYRGLSWLGR